MVFRVIEATAEDTGIAGNGVLKDSFGREIYLIEGIVLQNSRQYFIVTQDNLEEIHNKLVEHYHEFWECTVPNPAIRSEPFILQDNISDDSLNYQSLEPYIVNTNQAQTKQERLMIISSSQNIVSSRDCTSNSVVHSASNSWIEDWINWITGMFKI